MSCTICNNKYGIFRRETGCENCGLSFCSKCIKEKCTIPGKESIQRNLCKKCYAQLRFGAQASKSLDRAPPDAFLKRLDTLENPAAPPIVVYKQNQKMQNLRSGLSPKDQLMVDRLEKLKETDHPPPSESEIRLRLNILKGVSEEAPASSQSALPPPDIRTDGEKVEGLLKMYADQVNIQDDAEADNSDEEAERIATKARDIVALEERTKELKISAKDEAMDTTDPDELPWCVLCNNDAKYRCYGCEGDLYCKSCFNEFHKRGSDEADHEVVSYKPK